MTTEAERIAEQEQGASDKSDRATHERSPTVSAVPVGIPSEDVLLDISVMMTEFVDNWPEPKRISTALALIAKTLRAALNENESDALERAINRMGWPEIHAFQERLQQDVYEDAGGLMIRKIKRLFGINRDPVLTYQEAARAMTAQAMETRRAETSGLGAEHDSAVP